MPDKTNNPFIKFPAKTILLSGLLVGTLDILSAFVDYYTATGKNPLAILPYIASGVFGKSVLTDASTGMMVMGLLFHYFIAFSFTVFFFWLYSKTRLLPANWILSGFVYGIFIWVIMNLIVVQFSGVPHGPVSAMKFNKIIKSALILICMIGLPLSFIAHKYSPYKPGGNKESGL